jgi:hypothetical protein
MTKVKTTRNMGTFTLGQGLLERALYFPPGHRVVNAEWDEEAGSIRIYVEGDTLPEVQEVGVVPQVNPQIITRPTIGFGAPSYEWIWNPAVEEAAEGSVCTDAPSPEARPSDSEGVALEPLVGPLDTGV